jgi:hypothetical protein
MKPPKSSLFKFSKTTNPTPPKSFIYRPTSYISLLIGIIILSLVLSTTLTHLVISVNNSHENKTPPELPKDIDWFYNQSAELEYLRSRIIYIDNQTSTFIEKHSNNETKYDQNEKDKISSLKLSKNTLTARFNEMAANYNAHASNMNRSWNKTLPRQIYDM